MAVCQSQSASSSSLPETENSEENNGNKTYYQPLIPGLPDEMGELCLLRIPYPYNFMVRSVSSSWNRIITDPSFILSKKALAISLPFLFVFAFDKATSRIQWHVLDPRSHRWFVLPPVPCPKEMCPQDFACASLPRQGKVFLLGGTRSDTNNPMQTTYVYRASTNQWSVSAPMITQRGFFAAGTVDGKIMAVGGNGTENRLLSVVECYNPESDKWTPAAKLRTGITRYDSAVMGNKMYVSEGWSWPFTVLPRGGVYDIKTDTWHEMRDGMKEGWTGYSVVLNGRLFVISEHGDCRMKVYLPDDDKWQYLVGDMFPRHDIEQPYAVNALEGKIYVVAVGLKVGIGTIYDHEDGKISVRWKIVDGPKAFSKLTPASSLLVYA